MLHNLHKKRRGFLDISFSWIFAIIIGAMIIAAAVYGVSKFSKIEETKSSAISATDFTILLNPLETSVESAKSIYIKMPVESRIKNTCSLAGVFGNQVLSLDEYIKNKWSNSGVRTYSENKYIFSKGIVEGKGFYIFSKPFEFPFKVSNLMYLTQEDEKYCFVDPPVKIKKELIELNQPNLKVGTNCLNDESYTKVCYGNTKCDITVGYKSKFVKKGKDVMYFKGDSLMYAAIFSDKRNYECQLGRLMKRVQKLTEIYEEKALNIQAVGCVSGVLTDLGTLRVLLDSYKDSEDLVVLENQIEEIETINDYSKCKLW